MQNSLCGSCGGCPLRGSDISSYRKQKESNFKDIISNIKNSTPIIDEPIFIEDGLRRRAEMDFCFEKKELKLGFNENKSHNIIDINQCLMLDSSLNEILPKIKEFLKEFISIAITVKVKKNKIETKYINKGSIRLLKADNGIDVLFVLPINPGVEHRMLVADFVNLNEKIIRFCWQINNSAPEEIVTKISPKLYISDYEIDIPVGAFLQASKDAETKMINKVLGYLGEVSGSLADLFCGLGTFTYPLSKIKGVDVLSIDSSGVSLKGLEKAIAVNQIHNVKVVNKNLFKYPLDKDELKGLEALVIDPPRAGAHEQCRQITQVDNKDKPKKIVFVSCNPSTFVYDANTLIQGNYKLEKITLVDQFVYSNHMELIALFTLNQEN